MKIIQLEKAKEIMTYLEQFDFVKSSEIIGSLKTGNSDQYSDIDIRINVSGSDNGKVLLMLPYLLSKKYPIIYTAFAPRFAPDLYVVSFGLKDMNFFHFIDIECVADPHISSLSKDDIRLITNMNHLKLKLYIGLLKKMLRGEDISGELSFFSAKDVNLDNAKVILKDEFLKLKENENKNVISIIDKSLEILKTLCTV